MSFSRSLFLCCCVIGTIVLTSDAAVHVPAGLTRSKLYASIQAVDFNQMHQMTEGYNKKILAVCQQKAAQLIAHGITHGNMLYRYMVWYQKLRQMHHKQAESQKPSHSIEHFLSKTTTRKPKSNGF